MKTILPEPVITEVEHVIDNTDSGPVRNAALIVAPNQAATFSCCVL